jgi:hypothetical protein
MMLMITVISSNILWQRFHLNETDFLSRQRGTLYKAADFISAATILLI